MKTSKYINKYDFINYFTKQKSFWFFSNSEITAKINTTLKELALDEDDNTEEELDEEETSFDSFEYYKEQKELNKDIDNNDPRIVEGIIIDQASRKYIINTYSQIKTVVDFETKPYNSYNQEQVAKITQELIETNKDIILFQPVFIHEDLITKPDAIIKIDDEIILAETKSTTTSKLHHFLDIYFQNKVLNRLTYLKDYYFDLNLCLVAYNYANKNEVNFIMTNAINYTSSPNFGKDKNLIDVYTKQLIKTGKAFFAKIENEYTLVPDCLVTFNTICNEDWSELDNKLEILSSAMSKKAINNFKENLAIVYQRFDRIIQELLEHKKYLNDNSIMMPEAIEPNINEKSYWKKSDLFAKLREVYYQQGYTLFKYSGKVVKFSQDNITKYLQSNDYNNIEQYFINDNYRNYYLNNHETIINKSNYDKFLELLKPKKVYFDFETINSPIRPIDHCLPFMQILTQCSVIIDDNTKPIKDVMCNNILIDPLDIKISDFKTVVDALYQGSDYSYVVYNKNFERSRLKELAKFINEQSYSLKIETIINNLYDLADFFNVCKVKDGGPIIIIPELSGWYSIKKVLPIVMNKRKDIFLETGCVDYHDLEVVQNGLICQSETTKRFHNLLTDKEWLDLSTNLKKYCENDVRAMIAVEYYVKSLG